MNKCPIRAVRGDYFLFLSLSIFSKQKSSTDTLPICAKKKKNLLKNFIFKNSDTNRIKNSRHWQPCI